MDLPTYPTLEIEESADRRPQDFLTRLNDYLNTHGLMLEKSQYNEILGVSVLRSWEPTVECKIEGLGGIVEFAARWENCRQWIIGDIINIGDRKFGEEFSQYLPAEKTLVNWSSVCSQYAHHERSHHLPFSHYSEVAYEKDKRLRSDLLERAENESLTIAELRALKNASDGKANAVYMVRGLQRYSLVDGFRLGLINELEMAGFQERGITKIRVEYQVSGDES